MTVLPRSAESWTMPDRRAVLRGIASGLLLAASTAALSACGRGPDSVAAARRPAPGTLVMIIRHGEKPDGSDNGIGPDGKKDKASLTARGHTRAARLVELFDPVGAPARPGLQRPAQLYAADANDEGEGKRTRETIAPLAARLGLAVNTSFGKGQERELVESVLSGPGPTLICWQHGEIPAIVAAFGRVAPTPPGDWPSDRFDVIWTLTASGAGWSFAQIPELVVPGDRAEVITD